MKILPAASLLPLYLLLLVELGAAEHVLPIELKDRVQAHKRHTLRTNIAPPSSTFAVMPIIYRAIIPTDPALARPWDPSAKASSEAIETTKIGDLGDNSWTVDEALPTSIRPPPSISPSSTPFPAEHDGEEEEQDYTRPEQPDLNAQTCEARSKTLQTRVYTLNNGIYCGECNAEGERDNEDPRNGCAVTKEGEGNTRGRKARNTTYNSGHLCLDCLNAGDPVVVLGNSHGNIDDMRGMDFAGILSSLSSWCATYPRCTDLRTGFRNSQEPGCTSQGEDSPSPPPRLSPPAHSAPTLSASQTAPSYSVNDPPSEHGGPSPVLPDEGETWGRLTSDSRPVPPFEADDSIQFSVSATSATGRAGSTLMDEAPGPPVSSSISTDSRREGVTSTVSEGRMAGTPSQETNSELALLDSAGLETAVMTGTIASVDPSAVDIPAESLLSSSAFSNAGCARREGRRWFKIAFSLIPGMLPPILLTL